MSSSGYFTIVDGAAGILVVSAALIVWRRELSAMIHLLAIQGIALGVIPLVGGIRAGDGQLIVVGLVVMILRGAIFPKLLVSELRGEQAAERESRPLVNTSASLLITAVLVIVAYVTSEPMIAINRTPSTQAVPIGMAMALIAVFLLITRRKAISQVIALLMLDNGIDAVAFLATPGVPLIVELGASLDVLFALIILGVLAGRMYTEFASGDLDELRALREK